MDQVDMHEQFRQLLSSATGRSELVIAANADIRGFSKFSLEVESVEAAIFIKKVYARILDNYFQDAAFFKPTGDGLLLIFPVAEELLEQRANELVADSIRLVEDFPSLLAGDALINFPVPQAIGVGLARGAASALVAEGTTLDYSGKVLNLASRLMDLARPAGVVLDESFGFQLLEKNLADRFTEETVYVRSVAEASPLKIFYTTDFTDIPPAAKRPLEQLDWHRETMSEPLKVLEGFRTDRYRHRLDHFPLDERALTVTAEHPDVTSGKRKHKTLWAYDEVDFSYELVAGKPEIAFDTDALADKLKARGVGPSWEVRIVIAYPKR